MTASKSISLDEFLSFFPLVDLPIALSDEIISQISKANKILPVIAITTFISQWEPELDDATEIMACCQLPLVLSFWYNYLNKFTAIQRPLLPLI